MSEYVAIVGSRDYPLLDSVREYVATLPQDTIVVSGGAKGVDSVAVEAAQARGMRTLVYHPNWSFYGKSAGFIRNQQIVTMCNRLVAFHANGSKGTAHSIGLARKAGKPVLVFDEMGGEAQP